MLVARDVGDRKDDVAPVGFGRMMAWQLRAVSSGIALMVVGYVSLFCTEVLHMEPALVATLLLVSKIVSLGHCLPLVLRQLGSPCRGA